MTSNVINLTNEDKEYIADSSRDIRSSFKYEYDFIKTVRKMKANAENDYHSKYPESKIKMTNIDTVKIDIMTGSDDITDEKWLVSSFTNGFNSLLANYLKKKYFPLVCQIESSYSLKESVYNKNLIEKVFSQKDADNSYNDLEIDLNNSMDLSPYALGKKDESYLFEQIDIWWSTVSEQSIQEYSQNILQEHHQEYKQEMLKQADKFFKSQSPAKKKNKNTVSFTNVDKSHSADTEDMTEGLLYVLQDNGYKTRKNIDIAPSISHRSNASMYRSGTPSVNVPVDNPKIDSVNINRASSLVFTFKDKDAADEFMSVMDKIEY